MNGIYKFNLISGIVAISIGVFYFYSHIHFIGGVILLLAGVLNVLLGVSGIKSPQLSKYCVNCGREVVDNCTMQNNYCQSCLNLGFKNGGEK